MWFIGVEVEQETSAPSPKKNPGSATDSYLAQASLFPTLYHYMLLIIIITFWRETSPKSLPPGNKGSTQNIRWFLKTHYNHQIKINITAKRSYQLKIIRFFFRT